MDEETKNILNGIYQKLDKVERHTAGIELVLNWFFGLLLVYGIYLGYLHFTQSR